MTWTPRFLRPAPHIARVSAEQAQKIYPKLRWQILESTFIGYAAFYLVRNNLPVVSKEMGQALVLSKDQIGDMLALMVAVYGLGRFVMGSLSDRSNPRYFMALGLLATAACNFAFAAVHSYPAHLALWGLNGLAQSMGWAPCGRSLSHWYSVRERGTIFGVWNLAQNVGGGLIGVIAAYSAEWFGWRSAFYVPGILATICAIYLMLRLRDTPQSVGLPPIEEYLHDYPDGRKSAGAHEKELGTRELLVDYILKNRNLWLIAGANFFVYIARYAMLDWGPTFLKEVKHASLGQGGIGTATLEFSAMASTVLAGWLSDKIGGRRGMICVVCMIPAFLAFVGILYSPDNKLWLDLALFGVIGFFVYPAQMLLGICALDVTSKKAVGTANGLLSILGSLGRVAESKGIGALAQHYGWNAALYGILIAVLVGIVLMSFLWNLTPKSGEARLQASQ
ncbi:MAG: MFS transporter [Terracidiphilus sp.]|nr:MFS transporter [Terracidiphilus sp.]MDR3798037.1 MFS transporter [Terracidiphilus sp.]